MSADVCLEHGEVDTPGHPCLMCIIAGIRDWAVSKDGSVESAEKALSEIQAICEKTLGMDPEDE